MPVRPVLIMLLVSLLLVAGCTATSPDPPPQVAVPVVEPTGTELVVLDGVGSVYSGTVDGPVTGLTAELAPPLAAPAGVLAVGPGLRVHVPSAKAGEFEIRLELPPEPTGDAIPGVLHVADDGTMAVEPGLWDPARNEIVVRANQFSDRFGVWYDPRNWLEETVQVGQGAWDFVADWMTGRTDPPPCGEAPTWSKVTSRELSSAHVCLQDNPANDRQPRAELLLKSNRRTLQVITVPSTTKDYLWVQDQPSWYRDFWPGIAGVDGKTNVLLFGGGEMSMGFRQPEISTSAEMRSYLTTSLAFLNPAVGLLGGDLAKEGMEAMAFAAFSCAQSLGGTDAFRYDVLPTGFSGPEDYLKAGVTCVLEFAGNRDLLMATIEEITAGNPALRPPPERMAALRGGLERIEKTAGVIARGLNVAAAVTTAWDGVFDGLAEGQLTLTLQGTKGDGRARSTGNDLQQMWDRWKELNDVCRGGSPGPPTDAACAERDRIMRDQAFASAKSFLAAWRGRDAVRMKQLSTLDARDTFGRPLVPSLLEMQPAEAEFEMNYDVEQTGKVSAYIRNTDGTDLYFEWSDNYDKGWLVKSFAPDVG